MICSNLSDFRQKNLGAELRKEGEVVVGGKRYKEYIFEKGGERGGVWEQLVGLVNEAAHWLGGEEEEGTFHWPRDGCVGVIVDPRGDLSLSQVNSYFQKAVLGDVTQNRVRKPWGESGEQVLDLALQEVNEQALKVFYGEGDFSKEGMEALLAFLRDRAVGESYWEVAYRACESWTEALGEAIEAEAAELRARLIQGGDFSKVRSRSLQLTQDIHQLAKLGKEYLPDLDDDEVVEFKRALVPFFQQMVRVERELEEVIEKGGESLSVQPLDEKKLPEVCGESSTLKAHPISPSMASYMKTVKARKASLSPLSGSSKVQIFVALSVMRLFGAAVGFYQQLPKGEQGQGLNGERFSKEPSRRALPGGSEVWKEVPQNILALPSKSHWPKRVSASVLSDAVQKAQESESWMERLDKAVEERDKAQVGVNGGLAQNQKQLDQEHSKLLWETIQDTGEAPSDKMYAHLLGAYGPDLRDTQMGSVRLEGHSSLSCWDYLADSLGTYLQHLASRSPELSSICRNELCASYAQEKGIPLEQTQDLWVLERALEKVTQARRMLIQIKLGDTQGIFQEAFEALLAGDSFYVPTGWRGRVEGHALALEVERQVNGKATLRLFNYGLGAQYHKMQLVGGEWLQVGFYEVVEVSPERLFGGGLSAYLQEVQRTFPSLGGEWDEKLFYAGFVQAFGGKESARKIHSDQLVQTQYIANCALAPAQGVIDRLMVSQNLAERVRFMILARATEAYFKKNQNRMEKGALAEPRRQLLLKGIQGVLEQGERALEARGLFSHDLERPLKRLKEIRGIVEGWQEKEERNLVVGELSFHEGEAWSSSSIGEKSFEGCMDLSLLLKGKEVAPLLSSPLLEVEVDLSEAGPETLLPTLERVSEQILKDQRWRVKETLRQLPLKRGMWEGYRSSEVKKSVGVLFTLLEQHFLQQVEERLRDPSSRPTSHAILGFLKVHTLIDQLIEMYPQQMGEGLPPVTHPWIFELLGVEGEGLGSTVSPLPASGSWRKDLLAMRAYWKGRLPMVSPSLNSFDLFSFEEQPLASNFLTRKREILGEEHFAEFLPSQEEKEAFSPASTFNDIRFIQGWIASYPNHFRELFPELLEQSPIDQAVQVLGGRPGVTKGLPNQTRASGEREPFYIERLPGLAAGLRSVTFLEILRHGSPFNPGQKEGENLGFWKGKLPADVGYTAERREEEFWFRDPDTGKTQSSPYHTWVLYRNSGQGLQVHPATFTKDRDEEQGSGWKVEEIRGSLPYPDLEPLLFREAKGRRLGRLRLQGEKATPLDFRSMLERGTQEVRELLALSHSEELQISDTLGLFSQRREDLLDKSHLRVMVELLTEPGVLEKNLQVDEGLPSDLASFFHETLALAQMIHAPELECLIACLAQSTEELLRQSSLEEKGFPSGRAVFGRLLREEGVKSNREQEKTLHYFRVKSFENHETLSAVEAGELAGSVSYLEEKGLPSSWGKESLEGARELLHHRFRLQIRELLEHPNHRDTLLNEVAHSLDGKAKKQRWFPFDVYPLYQSEEGQRYDASTGLLYRPSSPEQPLPHSLQKHPLFTSLFSGRVERATLTESGVYQHLEPSQDGRASVEYLFFSQGGKEVIQRKFEGRWTQAFLPSEVKDFPFATSSEDRGEGGILWLPTGAEKEQIFYSDRAGKELFSLQKMAGSSSTPQWKGVSQEGARHLHDPGGEWKAFIARCERPEYTRFWSQMGEVQKIELPRLGLVFEKKEAFLVSQELKGFGLKEGQVPHFTFLGDFAGYLPLFKKEKSGQESQALLIPFRALEGGERDGLSTPTRLESPGEGWGRRLPWFLFQVKGNELVPAMGSSEKRIQAYGHLAKLFLSERRYRKAKSALNEMERLLKSSQEKMSRQVREQLDEITLFLGESQDASPSAAAVRLQGAAVSQRLVQLGLAEPKHGDQELEKNKLAGCIYADLYLYFNHQNRVPQELKLSPEHLSLFTSTKGNEGFVRTKKAPPEMLVEQPSLPSSSFSSEKLEDQELKALFSALPDELEGNVIFTPTAIFVRAFPVYTLEIERLFQNPEQIVGREADHLSFALGLESAEGKGLKERVLSVVELRYAYLTHQLSQLAESPQGFGRLDRRALQAEVQLLAALVRTGRGENPIGGAQWAERVQEVEDFVQSVAKQSEEQLKGRALALWKRWIQPLSSPLPSMGRATSASSLAPVKPVKLGELRFSLGELAPLSFTDVESFSPSLFLLQAPLVEERRFRELFSWESVERQVPPSPFLCSPLDAPLSAFFRDHAQRYEEFAHQLKAPAARYRLQELGQLSKIKRELKCQMTGVEKGLERREEALLAQMNQPPRDRDQRRHSQLRKLRGLERTLTLSDMQSSLARGRDGKGIKELNPYLSDEAVEEIFEQGLRFLVEKRQLQRLRRAWRATEKVERTTLGESVEEERVIADLREALAERLHYDPFEEPLFLLLETEFNIGLWEKQVPAMRQLALKEQVSVLTELTMGMGKTDVISPAVLKLLADGETIVALVMPEALVPSMTLRLQERMGDFAGGEVRRLPIQREERQPGEISRLRKELEIMMEQRIPVVWSSNDVQTLVNSYLEDMLKGAKSREGGENRFDGVCKEWQQLFSLLRSSGVILGDEIHGLLDILTSYNFTLGEPEPVSKDQREAVESFFKMVLSSREIVGRVHLDFLPQSGKEPFTEELWQNALKEPFIERALQEGLTRDPIEKAFLHSLSANKRELLKQYLSSQRVSKEQIEGLRLPQIPKQKNPFMPTQVQRIVSQLFPEEQAQMKRLENASLRQKQKELERIGERYALFEQKFREFLAVYKEGIRTLFPTVLTSQVNKDYAVNHNGDGACPAEEGTPQYDSLHGSTLERLFYGAMVFFYQDLPLEMIRQGLEVYVHGLRDEVASMQISEVAESSVLQQFQEQFSGEFTLSLKGFSDPEVKKIQEWVNAHPLRKLPFIRKGVFEKTLVYRQEIESSPHFLPLLAQKGGVRGMTGTLYNRATYPEGFTSAHSHLSDTTYMVTERILRVAPNTVGVVTFSGDGFKDISALYAASHRAPLSVIDTTGRFPKEQTEVYARALLVHAQKERKEIEGVVFYSQDDLVVLTEGESKPQLYDSKMNGERLVAFWDLSHVTGSNISLGREMHGALCIGKDISLFKLMQAAMRLRGLGRGQTLELITSESDKQVIQEKRALYLGTEEDEDLTVEQVIQYAVLTEFLKQTDHNYKALEMRLRMAVIEPVLEVLWNPETPPHQASKMFEVVSPLFIQKKSNQAWDQYGELITHVDLEVGKRRLLEKWLHHPVLEEIEKSSVLLRLYKVKEIRETLQRIVQEASGPFKSEVESLSYLGRRGRVNRQLKQNVQKREQSQVQEKEEVHEKVLKARKSKRLKKLLRHPYPSLAPLPLPSAPFSLEEQRQVALDEVRQWTREELLRGEKQGAGIPLREIFSLDPKLSQAIPFDDRDVEMSFMLAPVWRGEGLTPLYAPYDYFQVFASHALLIQEKNSGRVRLRLVTPSEAKAYAQLLRDEKRREGESGQELRLALYHLKRDRLINQGKEPLVAAEIPLADSGLRGEERLLELVVQGKLASGLLRYPDAQREVLEGVLSQYPNIETFFHGYTTRLLRHLDRARKRLPRSNLGSAFERLGVSPAEQARLLEDPSLQGGDEVQQLLFDLSLTSSERWDLAQKLEKMEVNLAEWSNVATPLLPWTFHPRNSGDITGRRIEYLEKGELVRAWMMNSLYPSIVDEYGAWKTVLPHFELDESELSWVNRLALEGAVRMSEDPDGAHLTLDLNQPHQQERVEVGVEQLEVMASLVHPLWGLPLVATERNTHRAWRNSIAKKPEMLQAHRPSGWLELFSVGEALAIRAIRSVDLNGSLKNLALTEPQYDFTRLRSLFYFLSQNNLEDDEMKSFLSERLV